MSANKEVQSQSKNARPAGAKSERRSVTYIALSTLAHLGLLTAIAAMPRPQFGSQGQVDGNAKGATVMMDVQDASAASDISAGNGGREVIAPQTTALEAQANSMPSSSSGAMTDPSSQITEATVTPPAPQPLPQAALPAKAAKAGPKPVAHAKKMQFASMLPQKSGAKTQTSTDDESLPEAVNWKAKEREQAAANAEMAKEPVPEATAENQPESQPQPIVATAPEAAPQPEPSYRIPRIPQIPITTAVDPAPAPAPISDVPASESIATAQNGASQTAANTAAMMGASGSGQGAAAPSGAGAGIPTGTALRNAEELAEQPGNHMPSYPTQDRVKHHEGIVVLVGKIAQDGHVTQATLQKGSGSASMDRASMDAFRKWKFAPGQEGYVYKSFRFSLKGDAQELPARLAQ